MKNIRVNVHPRVVKVSEETRRQINAMENTKVNTEGRAHLIRMG